MSFKLVEKNQKKTNIGLWETEVVLKLPKRYDELTREEFEDININFIPTEMGLMITRDSDGTFLKMFDYTKSKIDIDKFIQKNKDAFWTAIKNWKEGDKE